MSILWIIILAFLVALLVLAIASLILVMVAENTYMDDDREKKIAVVITTACVFLWIAFIFVGIGLNTQAHEKWIAQYEAQKATIEDSITSEHLSGLERVALVGDAAELNAELAARKVDVNFWHHITYGDIREQYTNLEPIIIK